MQTITAPATMAALVTRYSPACSALTLAQRDRITWAGTTEERITLFYDAGSARTVIALQFFTTTSGRAKAGRGVSCSIRRYLDRDVVRRCYTDEQAAIFFDDEQDPDAWLAAARAALDTLGRDDRYSSASCEFFGLGG